MASSETMQITVLSPAGSSVFGPADMAKETTVMELRTRILSAPNGFALDETVEIRNEGDDEWEMGVVTSLAPLLVKLPSAKRGCEFDQVRKVDALSKTCSFTLLVDSRRLEDTQTLVAALGQVAVAQLTAVFSSMTPERRQACMEKIASLAHEAYLRVMSDDEGDSDDDEMKEHAAEEREWREEQMTIMFGAFAEDELADTKIMTCAVEALGTQALKFYRGDLMEEVRAAAESASGKVKARLRY